MAALRPSAQPADPADGPIAGAATDRSVLRRDTLYRRTLAVADVLSAGLAVYATIVVLGDDPLSPALLVGAPLVILISKILGLYDRDEDVISKTTLDEVPLLFNVATLYAFLTWLASGALFEGFLDKGQVLGLWVLLFLSLTALRATARTLVTAAARPERCLVLGSAAAAGQIEEKLASGHALNAKVVGRIPFEPERTNDSTVVGQLESLRVTLAERNVQRVIIAPAHADSEELVETIRLIKAMGVKVSVLPRLFEAMGSSVRFDDVHGMTLLGLPQSRFSTSSRMLKRSFDMLVAGLGVLAVTPLLVAIAVAIKLSSSGPVLYSQARIGKDGREFKMLKFRSMVVDADARKPELHGLNEAGEGLFKIAFDPRITRVGLVLRRFCLDELPQLFNVLKGDMSLVGPRPLVPEDDQYVSEGWQRKRLNVPPGMTGIWQILGSSRIPLQEMVKIDYLYCATWSLWLDLKILLRTAPHVLARRGL